MHRSTRNIHSEQHYKIRFVKNKKVSTLVCLFRRYLVALREKSLEFRPDPARPDLWVYPTPDMSENDAVCNNFFTYK